MFPHQSGEDEAVACEVTRGHITTAAHGREHVLIACAGEGALEPNALHRLLQQRDEGTAGGDLRDPAQHVRVGALVLRAAAGAVLRWSEGRECGCAAQRR